MLEQDAGYQLLDPRANTVQGAPVEQIVPHKVNRHITPITIVDNLTRFKNPKTMFMHSAASFVTMLGGVLFVEPPESHPLITAAIIGYGTRNVIAGVRRFVSRDREEI